VSARPDIPRLSEEELDLLISRSLDGDLSPEERERLDRLVALDPAAARRRAELSALVADVKALPEPASPFALATRVSSNVAERAGRPGSLGARVGFFPAPGFAKAALVILGIVGASIAILRPAPKRLAEGPVDVLLYSAPAPASPTPQVLVAEAKPAYAKELAKARDREKAFAPEADARRNDAPRPPAAVVASEESADKKAGMKRELSNESAAAAAAPVAIAEAAPKQKADRDEGAALDAARAQAPAKVVGSLAASAPAPAAANAVPAGPPAAVSGGAVESRTPRGWTVSIRGDAVRRWSLRRAPDDPPPARGSAVYRVTLDASGRVTGLSRLGAGSPDPRLDAFVRGMLFEPVARPAEIQSRAAAKDTPAASPDIEIGLDPR
jgi:hypothetical protein